MIVPERQLSCPDNCMKWRPLAPIFLTPVFCSGQPHRPHTRSEISRATAAVTDATRRCPPPDGMAMFLRLRSLKGNSPTAYCCQGTRKLSTGSARYEDTEQQFFISKYERRERRSERVDRSVNAYNNSWYQLWHKGLLRGIVIYSAAAAEIQAVIPSLPPASPM